MRGEEAISPKQVRDVLIYDELTGEFLWKKRHSEMFSDGAKTAIHQCRIWNSNFAGKVAFTATDKDGYRQGSIFNYKLKPHRIAWAYCFGFWPSGQIDHINGNVLDNRIENLREVTASDNQKNRKKDPRNVSGFTGVNWHIASKKWRAFVGSDGKFIHLGVFSCFGQAVSARKEANKLFEFSDRHGQQ